MKKLLVTGASGFIGSFLVEEALKQGFEVYAGIRETSDLTYLQDKRIRFFKANLGDKVVLKQQLQEAGGFDFVIHNAGITKSCKKEMFDQVNFGLTKNLVEALTETNLIPEKFVFISSLAVYGPGNEQTMEPISENQKPNPVSLYGKSKLKTEQYLRSQQDFPYLIFRPTGVYGPREKDYYAVYKSINNGFETYIGTKEQYITFVYVRDLARLLINSLNSPVTQKSYFVTDLKEYSSVEFNNTVKNILNKKTIRVVFPKFLVRFIAQMNEVISCLFLGRPPLLNTEKYKEISQKNWLCDSAELVKDFDFQPKYNLEKGIREALEWYKQNKLL